MEGEQLDGEEIDNKGMSLEDKIQLNRKKRKLAGILLGTTESRNTKTSILFWDRLLRWSSAALLQACVYCASFDPHPRVCFRSNHVPEAQSGILGYQDGAACIFYNYQGAERRKIEEIGRRGRCIPRR
jgi:hypothetical protein